MKVLLITHLPPGKNCTGRLFLDQLCRFFKPDQLYCFSLQNEKLQEQISPDLNWVPIKYFLHPRETVPAIIPSAFIPLSAFIIFFFNQFFSLPPMIREAVDFGKIHGVTHVWCMLDGQCMTRIAAQVSHQLRVPLVTQTWDPPEWGIKYLKLDRISGGFFLKSFAKAMKQSLNFAAPSWAMGEEYTRKYGVQSVPIIPSLDAGKAVFATPHIHCPHQLVIGVAGKIYALDEWKALLRAFSSTNWMIGNRQVVIRYLGDSPKIPEHLKEKVLFLGWKTQDETILEMSKADILYCPYGFSRSFEEAARFSFPAKLTTYLASGRAVFFHGPEYSSPWKFLDKHSAGIACHSLKEREIVEKIQQLVEDNNLFFNVCKNGNEAFLKFLTTEKLRENFLKLFSGPRFYIEEAK